MKIVSNLKYNEVIKEKRLWKIMATSNIIIYDKSNFRHNPLLQMK